MNPKQRFPKQWFRNANIAYFIDMTKQCGKNLIILLKVFTPSVYFRAIPHLPDLKLPHFKYSLPNFP